MTTTEEELRRAYINEQNLREYQRNKSVLNRFNNAVSRYNQLKRAGQSLLNSGNNISSMGKNMSDFGSFLQKSSNPYINQIGNKIGNAGTNTQNFGNNLQGNINNRFNVNNNPVPNSSAVAVQQQPTSLTGKLSNGLEQNSFGLSNPQNVADSLPKPNQYTGKIFGGGFGQTSGMGNGLASSNMSSGLPMGADKLSFVGQGAGQTASGVGTGVGASTATTGTGAALGTTAGTTTGATTGTALGTTAGSTAGATAGTAGATTGGAMAGAGMASSVVPVIGWGIAIASLVANAINSQKKKQQARAMQASQQAGIDNEMLSEQQGQEAMQNIANQNQQFQANNNFSLQPDSATQEQINQQRVAELMSMMGGQPTGYASGIDQQQVANILNSNLQQNNGQITGGAAPVQQQPVATATPQAQQLNGTVTQTADPNAQPQTPAFGSQIYQTNNGTGKVAQIFDQIRQGYKDNTENTMGNTYFDPTQQKTFANRFGEALGTGQRIASNPIVQGLIAGGVNYANGGNIGNSLSTGIEWAKNKANSDRYEQLINGNNKRSFIGNYTADDYKNKLTADKYAIDNMINQNKADAYINNINNQIKNRDEGTKLNREKFDYDKKDKDRNFKEKQRTNKVKESQGWAKVKQGQERNNILRSKQISNPQSNPDWNNDLAELHSIVVSGDKNKIDYATQSFIKKYGIDPRKKISDKYYDDYDEYEDEEE